MYTSKERKAYYTGLGVGITSKAGNIKDKQSIKIIEQCSVKMSDRELASFVNGYVAGTSPDNIKTKSTN